MNNQQKGTILTLLKVDNMNRNYTNNYWFSYKDFLDPEDDFTDFSCERLDGKQGYIALIIFSKLSLYEIKQIFNAPQDIFPSDIGEETDFSQPTFLIGDNGELIPSTKLFSDDYFIYYCWWD